MTRSERDYLVDYLSYAPAALGVLRATECRKLAALTFERPILDVGCGDGLFARVLFGQHSEGRYSGPRYSGPRYSDKGVEVGLDYSTRELHSASQHQVYRFLVRGDVTHLPFADHSFATVLCNSVLEHVHDLRGGLREIARVLRPRGRLIFTVPTMESELQLGGAALLRSLGQQDLAQHYANLYNRVFGQINVFPLDTWREYLDSSDLTLVSGDTYGPPGMFRWYDLLLPASLPSVICKRLTGRWSLLTGLRRATVAPLWSALFHSLYIDEMPGCSLLIVAEHGSSKPARLREIGLNSLSPQAVDYTAVVD